MSGSPIFASLRRGGQRRARLPSLLAGLAASAACTLTQSNYEPDEVSRLDTAPTSADVEVAEAAGASCPDGQRCCTTSADCGAGEACTDGRCLASCPSEDPSACELPLCPGPACPARESCEDGVLSPGEAAIDCGGPCPAACPAGASCTADTDCEEGLVCALGSGRCTEPSCQDGVQSGSETLVDCGGGVCPGCPPGSPCDGGSDCDSGVCSAGLCAAPACPDGVANGAESGVDCGGSDGECPRCPDGQPCASALDCASQRCEAGACASCADGRRSGAETGTDCGGGACPACGGGEGCAVDADCSDSACREGLCVAARCDDGLQNGGEADVDCGGSAPGCAACGDGALCSAPSDCASGRCAAGRCVSCQDGLQNGSETGLDCGGPDAACARCAPGAGCQADADCASGVCDGGACCGGALGDCTRCALRLSPDVDCDAPAAGVDSTGVVNCGAFLACLSDNAERCPTRNTPGCSGDDRATNACPHNDYGGNAGTGLTRANLVLANAGCQL